MKKIILNEKEYAERCLRDNAPNADNMYQIIMILAKYYYQVLCLKKSEVYSKLKEYANNNYYMDCGMTEEQIQRVVDNAKKYQLYEINGVNITENEFAIINKESTPILRRVAFTFLCLAKYNNLKNQKNNGWVYMDSKDVFKLAHVQCGITQREIYIGKLVKDGLFESNTRNDDLSVRVTFIDDESNVKIFVDDFRELGYEYLAYCGKRFIRCAECGVLTPANKNNTKKYCNDCSKYKPMKEKRLVCVDCGCSFVVNSMNNRSTRCPSCYSIRRREYCAERQRRWRSKKTNVAE